MARKIAISEYLSKGAKWLAMSFAALVLVGLFLVIYIVLQEAKGPRWPPDHPTKQAANGTIHKP